MRTHHASLLDHIRFINYVCYLVCMYIIACFKHKNPNLPLYVASIIRRENKLWRAK